MATSSLEEVHARALAAHFKTHSAPNNVLCYGVRRKRAPSRRDPPAPDRGTPGGANIASRADLEVVTASAATKSLLGARAWTSSSDEACSNDAACDGNLGALAWIAHRVPRSRESE